jgi:hypothetical protein
VDINETEVATRFGPTLLATANEGHNYCCPEEAVCCEYIPDAATSENASRRPKSIPFCGSDATCTRDYYSNNRKLYKPEAVREAVSFTGDHFTDGLAHRTGLGVVGNVDYYTTNLTSIDDTCYYVVYINGDTNDKKYFDVSCQVLNGGTCVDSPARQCFAENMAPFDQIALEIALSGAIPCPTPTPHPWCTVSP